MATDREGPPGAPGTPGALGAPGPPGSPERPSRRVEAVVRGRVQGVGFRMFVAGAAANHGLVGWVANEPDDSVRTVAEGGSEALEAFVRDLGVGPPGARVQQVDVTRSAATGDFDRFAIRSGWHGGD